MSQGKTGEETSGIFFFTNVERCRFQEMTEALVPSLKIQFMQKNL